MAVGAAKGCCRDKISGCCLQSANSLVKSDGMLQPEILSLQQPLAAPTAIPEALYRLKKNGFSCRAMD